MKTYKANFSTLQNTFYINIKVMFIDIILRCFSFLIHCFDLFKGEFVLTILDRFAAEQSHRNFLTISLVPIFQMGGLEKSCV